MPRVKQKTTFLLAAARALRVALSRFVLVFRLSSPTVSRIRMVQYGALDLSARPPPPQEAARFRAQAARAKSLAAQRQLDRIRNEIAQHERIAAMHNLPAPPFNFGSPVGLPGDLDSIRMRRIMRPSASEPVLPPRHQQLPQLPQLPQPPPLPPARHAHFEPPDSPQRRRPPPVLGGGGGGTTLPALEPRAARPGIAHDPERVWSEKRALPGLHRVGSERRMPTREREWRSQMEAADAGLGPDPIQLHLMRKHGRRFKPGALASQNAHLTGKFAPVAVANVRICKVVNGVPLVATRAFANPGDDE